LYIFMYVFSFVKFVVHYSATEEFSKFSTNQLISKFFKIYTLLGLLDLIRCLVDHFYRTIEHFFKNIYPKYTTSQFWKCLHAHFSKIGLFWIYLLSLVTAKLLKYGITQLNKIV
jgi:hypothetical protein